jgi:hypothetical protein
MHSAPNLRRISLEARRLCEGIKFEKCHWKKQDPVLSQESIGHHSGARKADREAADIRPSGQGSRRHQIFQSAAHKA